ncbi:MAG: hypothetical protein QM622_09475 [Microbacterium sp.]
MSISGGIPQEHGETVAEYSTYEGAQKAVSELMAGDVPARDIAIVGRGLRSIETVTGKLGYAAAARSGAINGILLGLLFSAIFVLGTESAGIQLFVGVMFVGIAFGMLMSIVSYAIVRRRRDYASVTQVIADHYEVTVLPSSLRAARSILGPSPVRQPATASPEETPAAYGERIPLPPPQYGERIDPGASVPSPDDAGDAHTDDAPR